MVVRHRFSSVDTDYFQFFLQDAEADFIGGHKWTAEAIERGLAVEPFIVAVFTERRYAVWIDVEQHDAEPDLYRGKHWRQVTDCSLHLPSGDMAVTSPTLHPDCWKHILMAPGWYRLRVHYGKNSSRGAHRYKIALWPDAPAEVIMRKSGQASETIDH